MKIKLPSTGYILIFTMREYITVEF
jgi:hypothetical protein